ncbi:serine/threonine-protein kinase Chk1p [Monosporozyma servazzii]
MNSESDIIPTQIYEHQNDIPEINGFKIGETLGQGSFGIVKSASLDGDPSMIVAIKFINLVKCKDQGITEKIISKEVVLHSECSKHPNVLKLIDYNIDKDYLWIILEMADGGDLFDKIEPDIGVDNDVAQFYFQQLTNAVAFLHNNCGIAHRDIKPENILLDRYGNLKLADFGLATKFRRKDETLRRFNDTVGSPPYMAPEIFNTSKTNRYYANLTDVWSIGIFIFVLLTGEIPWQLPIKDDASFADFMYNNGNINSGPWARIDFKHLNLLRKILQDNPTKRILLSDLQKHPWYVKQNKFANSKGLCKDPHALARALMSNLKISLTTETYDTFMSQDPFTIDNSSRWGIQTGPLGRDNFATQPLQNDIANLEHKHINSGDIQFKDTNLEDKIFYNTQKPFTQYETALVPKTTNRLEKKWLDYISNDVAILQFITDENEMNHTQIGDSKNVDLRFKPFNLTKFFSLESMDNILSLLEKALQLSGVHVKPGLYDSFLKLSEKYGAMEKVFPLQIGIKTVDRRHSSLNGTIIISLKNSKLKVLEFQRKRGDPLEWRRLFKKIALFCKEIILIPNNTG